MNKFTILFLLVVVSVIAGGCDSSNIKNKENRETTSAIQDLPQILKSGKVRVVTNYNSTNYFVYKGQPMGYQFELLQEFANFLGLKLEVTVSNDLQANYEDLRNGNIDIIASSLAVTRESEEFVAFTEPHSYSRQVLVQQSFTPDQVNTSNRVYNEIIRNQLNLAGKSIYVQKGSAFVQRLRNLSNEIGDSINIIEIPDYEVEQLINLVSEGEIPFTVCDENLARVNLNFYPNSNIV